MQRPPTDPDYDPRTLYVPESAFRGFSNFEKQYWAIKKDLWDTVVFFQKGKVRPCHGHVLVLFVVLFKRICCVVAIAVSCHPSHFLPPPPPPAFLPPPQFYELFEKDAMIGHEVLDLKLTDRTNMCMVGGTCVI